MSTPTPKLYSVTEAAKAVGVSATSVRTYTDYYTAHLSDYATGRPRQYTGDDLRVLSYVAHSVSNLGRTHEQTQDAIIVELSDYEWAGPTPAATADRSGAENAHSGDTAALVPMPLLQAAQAMLQDKDRELQRLRDELNAQRGRVEQLQHELGRSEGQLEELRRPWWRRFLGLQ